MPESLVSIQAAHDQWIDSLIKRFQDQLDGIIHSAQARTIARLRDTLTFTDGRLDRALKNGRALRALDDIWMEEMDRAGYQHLLDMLVGQFPGQLPYFQDILEVLSAQMKEPLPPVKWSPRDLKVFSDQALAARDGLDAIVQIVAQQAKGKILLSYGGLKFADLADALARQFHRALPEAVGLAETATSTYYRVVADRGYRIIEADHPESMGPIKYSYFGPLDKLNRPFCAKMRRETLAGESWTRAQIDAMDNGMTPVGTVFTMCGGYRCRHQFIIATREDA